MIRSMKEFASAFHAARCVSTPLAAVRTADPASTTHFIIETFKQGRELPPLLYSNAHRVWNDRGIDRTGARTCGLGPRFFDVNWGGTADLQDRSAPLNAHAGVDAADQQSRCGLTIDRVSRRRGTRR